MTTLIKFLIAFILFSFNFQLYAEDIISFDRKNLKESEKEILSNIKKDEAFYIKVINDKNANPSNKIVSLAQLGSLYLANEQYKKARVYLEMLTSTKDINPKNSFISTSEFNLAMIYIHGKGTAINNKKAFLHFSNAAKAGNVPAMKEIAVMCVKKEVDDNVLHKFTDEMVKNLQLDKSNSDYKISYENILFLLGCSRESAYLKNKYGIVYDGK